MRLLDCFVAAREEVAYCCMKAPNARPRLPSIRSSAGAVATVTLSEPALSGVEGSTGQGFYAAIARAGSHLLVSPAAPMELTANQ